MKPYVLIVDDDPVSCRLLTRLVEPMARTACARSGQEMTAALAHGPVDLVLLDLGLPDTDGVSLLTSLKQDPATAQVPVVLVTGSDAREDRIRGVEAGADDFLTKPIDATMLQARVRTLLRLKENRDLLVKRTVDLEASQQRERELTAFVVHDLKNPLQVIGANLAWIHDTLPAVDPEVHEALRDAEGATARLGSMVSALLSVVAIEQRGLSIAPTPCMPGELMRTLATQLTHAAARRQLTLQVEADSPVAVWADKELMRRVMENLLDNAMQYTPEGGRILLRTRRVRSGVELAVANTGRVIPPGERVRVFARLARGSGEHPSEGHVGLGLYFCRRVVEAHGGTLDLTDDPGWPVMFTAWLPSPAHTPECKSEGVLL